jgi:hypothetical protein
VALFEDRGGWVKDDHACEVVRGLNVGNNVVRNVNVLLFAFIRTFKVAHVPVHGVRGPEPWPRRNKNGFIISQIAEKIQLKKVMSSYFAERTTSRRSTKEVPLQALFWCCDTGREERKERKRRKKGKGKERERKGKGKKGEKK